MIQVCLSVAKYNTTAFNSCHDTQSESETIRELQTKNIIANVNTLEYITIF